MGKLNNIIIEANKKGYKVLENGDVQGLKKILSLIKNKAGYSYFSIRDSKGKREIVLVHRLQAYQKFGDKIFEEGIQVRHLDGNPLNNSFKNIKIGNASENAMDKNPKLRYDTSIIATRKYQDNIRSYDERCLIYEDLKRKISYKEIGLKYNIAKGTLSFMKNKSIEYKEYLEK